MLPAALISEIVGQLESAVMCCGTPCAAPTCRAIDAELHRARPAGILRHHAERAQATGRSPRGGVPTPKKLLERLDDAT